MQAEALGNFAMLLAYQTSDIAQQMHRCFRLVVMNPTTA